VLVVFGLGSTIGATPRVNAASSAKGSASLRKEAQRLEDRLEATGERLSQLAEDWNEANEKLAALEEKTKDATAELAGAEVVIRSREKAAIALALGRYTGASGSFGGLDTNLSMESNARREVYSAVGLAADRDVLDRLRADREDLDRLKGKLAKRKAAMAEQRAAIKRAAEAATALEDEQTKLLTQTKGRLGAALAAEEKRRLAAEEAAVKARLAAQVKAAEKRRAAEQQAAARSKSVKGKAKLSERLRPSGSGASGSAEQRAAAAQAEADRLSSEAGPDLPSQPGSLPPGTDEEPAVAGAKQAIAVALSQVGKPYQWGATGPGSFDCSGLMMYAWRAAGRSIPRSSRTQFAGTRRIAVSQIKPGDLVFYGSPIHHVGMYIGNGNMVEASRRGVPVRVRSIFRRDLVGVGRVQ
jgi:peptidoglycan DL-endopeptidase CwlO